MGSPHPFPRTHWDHEPELSKPLEINKTVFRFMESFNLQDRPRIGTMNLFMTVLSGGGAGYTELLDWRGFFLVSMFLDG